MSNITTCVDCILLSSSNVTLMVLSSGTHSARGASETKKFPVAPESSTAHFLMSFTLKSIVAKRLLAACPYKVLDVRVVLDVSYVVADDASFKCCGSSASSPTFGGDRRSVARLVVFWR